MVRSIMLALAVSLLTGSTAHAEDDRAIAKREFTEGTREFELGHFDEAIKHYEEAYRHRDDPVLLYNLAQTHRLAGHHAQAIRMYKQYLLRVPDAANRDEVKQKIAALEKLAENERLARSLPPEGTVRPGDKPPADRGEPAPAGTTSSTAAPSGSTTPPPSAPRPESPAPPSSTTAAPAPAALSPPREAERVHPGRGLKIAGIAVAALGLGALAGGIATGVLTQQASDAVSAEAKAAQHFDPATESRALTDQTAEVALLAAGSAALVGGVVLYYLGWRRGAREGDRRFVVQPRLGRDVAALTLDGRF